MKQFIFIHLTVTLLTTSVAFAEVPATAPTDPISELTSKLSACLYEGHTRDFCINKYRNEINAVQQNQNQTKESVMDKSMREGNANLQAIQELTNQAIDKVIDAIPGKPLSTLPRASKQANPQKQTIPSTDKLATLKTLSLNFNAAASKVPGYTALLANIQTISNNLDMCHMNVGDPIACTKKYQLELDNATQALSKLIHDSMDSGNIELKTAYDNLNRFTTENGMPTVFK